MCKTLYLPLLFSLSPMQTLTSLYSLVRQAFPDHPVRSSLPTFLTTWEKTFFSLTRMSAPGRASGPRPWLPAHLGHRWGSVREVAQAAGGGAGMGTHAAATPLTVYTAPDREHHLGHEATAVSLGTALAGARVGATPGSKGTDICPLICTSARPSERSTNTPCPWPCGTLGNTGCCIKSHLIVSEPRMAAFFVCLFKPEVRLNISHMFV